MRGVPRWLAVLAVVAIVATVCAFTVHRALAPAAFNVSTIACALLVAPLMPAIGQPRIMAVALGAILGGFGQIAADRFFEKHRRAGLRTGDPHIAMQIEMAIRDADDVWPFLLQHLPIVGVGGFGAEPFLGGDAARLILICDGDDLRIRNLAPYDVEPVPIVASSGSANDGNAIVWHGKFSERAMCTWYDRSARFATNFGEPSRASGRGRIT